MRENHPNVEQSKSYSIAYDQLNIHLFGATLPPCMLTLTRNQKIIGGYFSPDKWTNDDGDPLHEIAINANLMQSGDPVELFTILIHEMIHLKQHEDKTDSRNGYHNKQFAELCNGIGLTAENQTGGNTGQAISSNLIPNGAAEKAIMDLPDSAVFPYFAAELNLDPQNDGKPAPTTGAGGKKSKYTCPICGLNAWGKPGLRISCLTDSRELVEQVTT